MNQKEQKILEEKWTQFSYIARGLAAYAHEMPETVNVELLAGVMGRCQQILEALSIKRTHPLCALCITLRTRAVEC